MPTARSAWGCSTTCWVVSTIIDMRDSTVAQFRRRYQVEADQVERVEATALSALDPTVRGFAVESDVQFLSWATRLHEIGISVAHNAYHKHGAYILTYADMPGFSKKDQARLAMLVLGHRGKLEKLGACRRSTAPGTDFLPAPGGFAAPHPR
jgi:exopolyphosphatase/guanosine-5'-triphosphate,3'-diphosphate pyrophosphatase